MSRRIVFISIVYIASFKKASVEVLAQFSNNKTMNKHWVTVTLFRSREAHGLNLDPVIVHPDYISSSLSSVFLLFGL
jgi:hypothetical protein